MYTVIDNSFIFIDYTQDVEFLSTIPLNESTNASLSTIPLNESTNASLSTLPLNESTNASLVIPCT